MLCYLLCSSEDLLSFIAKKCEKSDSKYQTMTIGNDCAAFHPFLCYPPSNSPPVNSPCFSLHAQIETTWPRNTVHCGPVLTLVWDDKITHHPDRHVIWCAFPSWSPSCSDNRSEELALCPSVITSKTILCIFRCVARHLNPLPSEHWWLACARWWTWLWRASYKQTSTK